MLRLIVFAISAYFSVAMLGVDGQVHAESLILENRWSENKILQASNGNVISDDAPQNADAAEWTAEPVQGITTFLLRNKATGTYLANTDQGLALTGRTEATSWRLEPYERYVRLKPDGFEGTLNIEDDVHTPQVSTQPDGAWSQDWITKVPSFATDRLNHIQDWTKIDPAINRDEILYAASFFANFPDSESSLALKKRWARQFPYDIEFDLDRNDGAEIHIEGETLDTSSRAFNAQTKAIYVTGYWAKPGETITFEVPQSYVGQEVWVQIGIHDEERLQVDNKDGNEKFEKFVRFPYDMTVSQKVDAETIELRNGFGGVIVLVGGEGFNPGQGTTIRVTGGHQMPILDDNVLSGDSDEVLPSNVAPWSAIRSERLTTFISSKAIRDAFPARGGDSDLKTVISYWDSVMMFQDELVSIDRKAPDALILDIAMPPNVGAWVTGSRTVVAPLDWAETYLQRPDLKIWGLIHELGHNHQATAWSCIARSHEVTVNLPVLYAFNQIHGASYSETMEFYYKPGMVTDVMSQISKHLSKDMEQRQASWIGDPPCLDSLGPDQQPLMKLAMFALLAKEFGWDVFKDTFKAYQAPNFDVPSGDQNDQQKRDETLVRELSRSSGHNLADYFALWGFEVHDSLRNELSRMRVGNEPLKTWRPMNGDSISFQMPMSVSSIVQATVQAQRLAEAQAAAQAAAQAMAQKAALAQQTMVVQAAAAHPGAQAVVQRAAQAVVQAVSQAVVVQQAVEQATATEQAEQAAVAVVQAMAKAAAQAQATTVAQAKAQWKLQFVVQALVQATAQAVVQAVASPEAQAHAVALAQQAVAETPPTTNRLNLRNLHLSSSSGTEKGNVIWAAHGGEMAFDIQVFTKSQNVLVIGLRDQSDVGSKISDGIQTSTAGSVWIDGTGTLDIPQGPGAYEVCVAHSNTESADDLLARQKSEAFADCTTAGLVIVDN